MFKSGEIDQGKRYPITGRVFPVGFYFCQEIGSIIWAFAAQSDWNARNWLADAVATSIRSAYGDGYHHQTISGVGLGPGIA